MGVGAVLEPLVVVTLLFGGAWINRARDYSFRRRSSPRWQNDDTVSRDNKAEKSIYDVPGMKTLSSKNRSLSPSLLPSQEKSTRQRELRIFGYTKTVETPNTAVFRHRFLSRVLHKFPFLVEAWYWALIYWVGSCLWDRQQCTRLIMTSGVPTRPRFHRCNNCRRNSPCGEKTCPAGYRA